MKDRKPNPPVDNKNWQQLFNTQFENLQQSARISSLWINGLSMLGIDNSKVPSAKDLTQMARKYTGWEVVQTDDIIIASLGDWSRMIVKRQIPITSFVRTLEELNYCDEPDKWHDIIGHIPFLMDEEYSRMYQNISQLYLDAEKKGKKWEEQMYTIISYTIEVGIIEEKGKLKALGATLYSSSGELESAFTKGNYEYFDLDKIVRMNYYDRSKIQNKYFIVKSIDQLNDIVKEYRKKYLS